LFLYLKKNVLIYYAVAEQFSCKICSTDLVDVFTDINVTESGAVDLVIINSDRYTRLKGITLAQWLFRISADNEQSR
jgi:hypothetical protein